ncbi:MAG TPA: hypothetical protein VGH84_02150, partial [Steroidobacteraceae bacterium]
MSDATEGTRRLRHQRGVDGYPQRRAAFLASAKDPCKNAKISAAMRGRPRPADVMKALHEGNRGRKASAEARERMSRAQKERGVIPPGCHGPPWTVEELALLGTMRDREVAAR